VDSKWALVMVLGTVPGTDQKLEFAATLATASAKVAMASARVSTRVSSRDQTLEYARTCVMVFSDGSYDEFPVTAIATILATCQM